MKFHIVVPFGAIPFGLMVALPLSASALAQGVPGGISHGVSVGNQVAGPVGAVVGGAVGGVVGGVEGVLGIDPRPSYAVYSDEHSPEYRPHRVAKVSLRTSHHAVRHSPTSDR
jgi:hypothetical protein